jgi:hypothetical protein
MIYAFWGWLGAAFMLSKAVPITAAEVTSSHYYIYENDQSQII